MSPDPYWETDHTPPAESAQPIARAEEDRGPANECAMCGNREGPLFWGACRVLEGRDALGPRYRYFPGYRCGAACRERRLQEAPE